MEPASKAHKPRFLTEAEALTVERELARRRKIEAASKRLADHQAKGIERKLKGIAGS